MPPEAPVEPEVVKTQTGFPPSWPRSHSRTSRTGGDPAGHPRGAEGLPRDGRTPEGDLRRGFGEAGIPAGKTHRQCLQTAPIRIAGKTIPRRDRRAMPDHPIAKCKADVGLIAHLIVSKFADHLPLYRQDGIFEREGVTIPRATQSSWLMQIYESIRLLGETLRQAIFESDVIFTDDTPVPLQVKGNGKLKKARMWVYVRGGTGPPLTVYDFSIDRSKKRPLDFLKDYRGYVHADAYSGYDELFRKEGIIEVGCWAHARRKFDEAASSRPKEATDILARIARLYHEVETPCADMTPEERCRFRQEHAAPILDGIFEKIEEMRQQTIPSEPLRKAIDYALNQRRPFAAIWKMGGSGLTTTWRRMPCVRSRWVEKTGSLWEANGAAGRRLCSMGLIKSCKDCEINPWEYFDDMLRRIMSHPVNRLRELLPDQWKPLPKDKRGMILINND